MLDSDTKARIDSARDILVGKVPDPKSQVEQITIALIYKFMDDMDRQSEELGGKATFFTGDFKKYHWANLLDKRLGGHERLLLYAEGIEKMNENKNIPQLFRDIFKGVFLPYRDPETLNLFLKEIAGFSYDHSERLGDAFEYLLSVLGTQGDAGQFRTPRHIIDFIVAVVEPKKNETVLDPACGTAGFLISAFKHILRNNENLTPDERARLMTNFRGYDIAPDMVRLSRANLYLHGFPNPVIHEYDTLTSEERWDERCDVILANPPFMSPKGGIRPHNRFSIKAKRSEVLFVDYMAEHLNPGGRAGIIVPEGIIFQSQNAYKALRKMLVGNYLWAVVSLPAGVFNPYAGVKTSVLFLDRNLAKRTDEVLFVKVGNDGFDLGAQRRPIEGSQLAEAFKILNGHKKAQKEQEEKMALTVSRKRLLDSGDVNLSGDRYRVPAVRPNGKWPMVKLGEVCEFASGLWKGKRPPLRTIRILRNTNFTKDGTLNFDDVAEHPAEARLLPEKLLKTGDILLEKSGGGPTQPVGRVALFRNAEGEYSYSNFTTRMRVSTNGLCSEFLWHMCHALYNSGATEKLQKQTSGIRNLDFTAYKELEFPLPPFDEQERIVAELEGYRKVIEGARQILASYKPTVRVDSAWPIMPLGEVAEIDGNLVDPKLPEYAALPHVSAENMESGNGQLLEIRTAAEDKMTSGKYLFDSGCVLYSKLRPYLRKAAIASFYGLCSADMYPIRTKPARLVPEFLLWILLSAEFTAYADGLSHRARMPKLNRDQLMSYAIPLPPLDVQRRIVAELETERKMVDVNRELIVRMEKKIKDKLAEVWGEEGCKLAGANSEIGGSHG